MLCGRWLKEERVRLVSSGFVDIVLFLLFLLILTVAAAALRLVLLQRRPGSLQCSLRSTASRPWRTGVLVLGPYSLEWFRTRTLSLRPEKVFERSGFSILKHKPGGAAAELTIAKIDYRGEVFSIAMSPHSFAGLISWIDAAPPVEEPTNI